MIQPFKYLFSQVAQRAAFPFQRRRANGRRRRVTEIQGTRLGAALVERLEPRQLLTLIQPSSLAGFVFVDANNNAVKDPGESGIAGVQVSLARDDGTANGVFIRSTVTLADGSYKFTLLDPGTYIITETQPSGYLDGKEQLGSQGGIAGPANDEFSGAKLIATIVSRTDGVNNNFGELVPSSLSGFVYVDANDDGSLDGGDSGLGGATVTLTGIDDLGNAVNATRTTASDGSYTFTNLRPSNAAGYTLTESDPSGYLDGATTIGTQGGIAANNVVSQIVLNSGTNGINNNFGEVLAPTTVDLTASTVLEGGTANYTFTATVGLPVSGSNLVITTTQGVITIPVGQTTGTLVIPSNNTDDVYLDASSLTATITTLAGSNFVNLVIGAGSATAYVNDTIDTTTVNLSASTVLEGATANYTFTATVDNPVTGSDLVITTTQGVITIPVGQTTGTLVVPSNNTEDVYLDASNLTATITGTTGGNFENVAVGTASATAYVDDTIDTTTVNLSASTVLEAPVANYTFTATVDNPVTGSDLVITTTQGVITILVGQTTGTLVVPSGNTEDVYLDATNLTATITGTTGGNFENVAIGTASATAYVDDTIDTTTVNLSASTVLEGPVANYTFTATVDNPVTGSDLVITTTQGVITILVGQTTGTLVVPSGNTEDVYLDATNLTATITGTTGGNFENVAIGTASATAYVDDTIDTTTVNLSASTVLEGPVANYTFTATVDNPVTGSDLVITTTQGVITILVGQTTGTLVVPSGNTEDVYLDATNLTATITGTTGGNFENVAIGTASATAYVDDTIDTTTVNLTASCVLEGPTANYTFTATLSSPSQGTTTITTTQGVISIADGQSVGTLVIASGNTEDVYKDASSLTATITSAAGGNFENLVIGTASATACVNDTLNTTIVNLSASCVVEGPTANYTFTATLSNPSQGTTTITTNRGVITINPGQTTGTLVIASGNTEDVYKDASSLTATITSATGGNFENLVIGTASATACVNDTINNTTVNLTASCVLEGPTANYTFTATLSNPSQGTTTITTNRGVITIANGLTTGTLVIASGNTEDVYKDASSLTATITSATGGNFENLTIGTASATACVNDTINTTTVNLTASCVLEGPTANYTFTATLSNPSQGTTTITTNRGVITIANGQTTGKLVIASGNTEDVYLDASSLTATITSATGGNFENLTIGTASATAYVNDTINTTTVTLSVSTSRDCYRNKTTYTFTATLSNPSQGTTTIVTNLGTIIIGNGQTTGKLVLSSNVYNLTATITSAFGGNFEKLVVGTTGGCH